MGFRDSAAQGVLWTTVQSWGKRLMSLLVFVVLARLLQPTDFGLIALAMVVITVMTVVQESGFAQAIVQREDIESAHLDTALWFSLVMGIVFTSLLLAVAGPLAALLGSPDLGPVLRWLSPLFVLSGLKSTPTAILQRALHFKVLALRDTLSTLAGGLVGVGMALYGYGVYALVGQQLVQAVVAVLTLWTATSWRPTAKFSMPHLRQLYGFGVMVLGINALGIVSRQSDNLLIGAFLGNAALGLYAVGYRLLTMLTEMFVTTISQVTRPTLARLQRQPARLRRALYAATRMSSFVAFPIFLGLSAVAPEAVEVVFGDQWAAAVPVMRILGFVGALHAIMYLLGSALVAIGRPDTSLGLSAANAVLNLTGFAVVIALGFGITGVAAAYTVRAYLMAPVHYLVARRVIGLSRRDYLGSIVPAGVAALVMWILVVATTTAVSQLGAVPRLVLGVAVGALVYLGVIMLVARHLPAEALDFARRAGPQRLRRQTPTPEGAQEVAQPMAATSAAPSTSHGWPPPTALPRRATGPPRAPVPPRRTVPPPQPVVLPDRPVVSSPHPIVPPPPLRRQTIPEMAP